ncbi:hypothetical protein DID88_001666 [Monilinia fructigena]|uniref:Amino acid permease/ SLC12A domain-containing protein n=1 Tax=Monilinia fructigena TaxID=38457 RepID=A0A395IYY5_9HELO|nr:hypothetical protein DID88_001666 [Monilinia fructigena]
MPDHNTSSGGMFESNANQGELHRRNVVGMEEGPDADARNSPLNLDINLGLFATTMTTFSYPIMSGGSAAAVWCWLISGAGCMCIALSVAELVSAYPTSGGLYFTISRLVPEVWVPSLSWVTGWLNLLGQVAGVASSQYGASQMLLAAVAIGKDFDYVITANTTVGVMAGLMVLTGLVNSLSTYWMEKMTKSYVIFHVLVLVSCCIALLVKTPNKHDATYVFTDVQSSSGWTPIGFSFLFGFLSVSWTMTDYDATAHITEEISEPEKKAPWAISLAMLFTYIAGFLFNIVLCFCMGDPTDILGTTIGQPVAQLFFNSLGKAGAIFYTVCGFIILEFVCFTAMQSLARTVFAFSRDKLVPFSKAWTQILPMTGTPIAAVWISVALCIAINLIGLGSYTAISGVFNVCAIALDWSYCIPIVCKLMFGQFEPGPWHLVSSSFFPTERPVTALNMNYAIAFLGLILVFSTVYWYISGKKFYTGPVIEAADEDSLRNSLDRDSRQEKVENKS